MYPSSHSHFRYLFFNIIFFHFPKISHQPKRSLSLSLSLSLSCNVNHSLNPQESTTHLNGLVDPLHMKPVSVNIAIDHNSPNSEPFRNHHDSISNFFCPPQGFSFHYAWVWGYGPQIFSEISPMLWQGSLLMGSEGWFKSLWWRLILVASCGQLCCERERIRRR